MVRAFRRRAASSGLSMVELAAAVAVLTIVAAGGAWLAPAQVRGIVRSHEDDVALCAAEARIEALRARPAEIAAGGRAFTPAVDAGLRAAAGTETIERAGPGLVRLTVAVSWDAADGGRRTVRLVTLVAEEAGR